MHDNDIRTVIRRINENWRAARYDEIGRYLDENVVIAPPGSNQRIRGREAYVQSYRDYDQAAVTRLFEPAEPVVDVMGATAVAVCPFYIEYEMGDTIHREQGHDLLVFSRADDGWKVVWRTMQAGPVEMADDLRS